MEANTKVKSCTTVIREIASRKISFEHPLHPKSDQWDDKKMSQIIESVLNFYPMDSITVLSDDGTWYVLDGVKRLYSMFYFACGRFAISSDAKNVVINDVEYAIVNKKYTELPQAVKDVIETFDFHFDIYTNCTDNDTKDIISKKELLSSQTEEIRNVEDKEYHNFVDVAFDISLHRFFNKLLSDKDIEKGKNLSVAKEIIMLSEHSKKYKVTEFTAPELKRFAAYYNMSINKQKIVQIKQALNVLDKTFIKYNTNIASASFVVYSMYWCIRYDKSIDKCSQFLRKFEKELQTSEEYKKFCIKGVNKAENVMGRYHYFHRTLQKM